MAGDILSQYMGERNRAYEGAATEHKRQSELKTLEQKEMMLYTAKETTEAF